ncbi:DUF859 family phage minor structural protein [Eubacteriales bacterium KG125]
MASSGSFSTSSYDVRYLNFYWSVASQSIDSNQTVINWSLKGGGGNSYSWYMAGNFRVVINGSVVYSSSSRIQLYNGTTVASGSFKINHNSDGTKSFSASAEAGIYTYAVNCSGSGSWSLPTIARATQPTVSKTSATYEDQIVINLPRASSNFTHTIQAGVDGKLSFTNIATRVGTSYTWIIPKDWAKYLPTKSHKIRVRAITYSGNTQIGTKEASSISVSPTSDMKPVVSISLSDDMKYKDKYGGFVKGQSKIRAKVTEKLYAGTTVSSRSLSLNGVNYQTSEQVSEVIISTSQNISASVTDARGLTGSTSVKPTVYDWFIPKIGTFRSERCNSSGNSDEVGNYIRLDYSVEVAPVNNKNAKSLKYGYKKQSDTSWTIKDIALSSYSKSGNVVIPASGEYSWDVKIDLKDDFTTANLSLKVGTAYVLMDFHKSGRGIAIGKVSEREKMFEIAKDFEVKLKGETIETYIKNQILKSYPVGSIFITTNNVNPSNFIGGKWSRFAKGRTLIGVDENDADFKNSKKTGGSKDLPLPLVGEMGYGTGKGYFLNTTTMTKYGSTGRGWDIQASNEIKPNVRKPTNYNKLTPYITTYMWERIS